MGRAKEVVRRLAEEYPGSARDLCALDHHDAFQLLTATILSAQTTDVRVNMVTPVLFGRWPTPEALAAAPVAEVEEVLPSTGFFRQKTKSVQGMSRMLLDDFGGEVPRRIEDLTKLPGVGRKTANVVRSVWFGEPGLPVDTHVTRLAGRLGLTDEKDAVKIEFALNAVVPPAERGALSLRLILHGRRVCIARAPACDICVLEDMCPSSRLPRKR